jgi:hypothetical protein
MRIAHDLSTKGYVVRVHGPALLYLPNTPSELEFRVEWQVVHNHQAEVKSALVASSGLSQALKYFASVPSALTAQILQPLANRSPKSSSR